MVEGSPTDPAPQSDPNVVTPADPANPTAEEVEAEVAATGRTVEEVEAIWKNRIAGKDRAHAAEAATLRQQIEAANQRAAAAEARKAAEDAANMTEAEQWKAKAEENARELERERQTRILEVRSTKYSAAAEHLDEGALVAMDEAKLAALNARLQGDEPPPPPPIVDPNTPRRPSTAPPAPRERSVEELEADLRKHEPAFQAGLTEQ